MQNRSIRLRDAPLYLGMDKNRFNREVRPYVIEIPVGKQGVGFDRLDLDAWFEHYKACNGRPASTQRRPLWHKKEPQAYSKLSSCDISTNVSTASAFAKALEQVSRERQKGT